MENSHLITMEKIPSHHHGKFPSHHHGKFLSDLVLMVVSWQGLMGKVSPSDSRLFSSTSGPAKTGIHLFLTAWLGKTSRLPCPFIPPEFLRPFRILVAYGYMWGVCPTDICESFGLQIFVRAVAYQYLWELQPTDICESYGLLIFVRAVAYWYLWELWLTDMC